MSRPIQFKLNFICFVKDVFACNWRKAMFHFSGIKRSIFNENQSSHKNH